MSAPRRVHAHVSWSSYVVFLVTFADKDTCPYDAGDDFDGDFVCKDVDPCPYDFNVDDESDRICSDKPVFFSQLQSLQVLRKTFPLVAPHTANCAWFGAGTALNFGLGQIKCIQATKVFKLHKMEAVHGSLVITTDIA